MIILVDFRNFPYKLQCKIYTLVLKILFHLFYLYMYEITMNFLAFCLQNTDHSCQF